MQLEEISKTDQKFVCNVYHSYVHKNKLGTVADEIDSEGRYRFVLLSSTTKETEDSKSLVLYIEEFYND